MGFERTMRRLVGLAAVMALAGCATAPRPVCPAGQAHLRTVQLYVRRQSAGRPAPTEAAFRKFLAEEVSPRFPDGLTVMRGGRAWRASQDPLMRDAGRIVLIVVPDGAEADQRLETLRTAYRTRFRQEPVVVVAAPACVAF